MRYLLAGGGTAGHVNPLLATADRLRVRDADAEVLVLGTAEGLEARLVPQRGYELVTIPRLPFPRRPSAAALRFPGRWWGAVRQIEKLITDRRIDVVVGFGGYAAAPAYLAARRTKTPLVLHEANAKPGLASRLGSRLTKHVGVAFRGTPLPHAVFVGMPLRVEIEKLDRVAARAGARARFGLDDRPVLLVTGGSTGARTINRTMLAAAQGVLDRGYQVLHIQGGAHEFTDPGLPGYHLVDYVDDMDQALAAADAVVSRAGSGMVSELTTLGLPAVYVPYPVGNGEQRFNVADVVSSGGGITVEDSAFTPQWVKTNLLPLLRDETRLLEMAAAAASVGVTDGADRLVTLIIQARGA
ncbi:UDP-N-acetylglucosamine--N-acetylmuramyl-(pentapeptide) pyrophosphoryl-undecaprenol N-acetylglucosamine transferase [Gryllotalpicola protaetiae]|uniref:UDP-N-acetylglucosamine--N-acetylmuramyl-(pentapeptide) pyrophosphoryl-undecaprenol N-acetylglucosamine transferase n=1 Tax=Gryllotalpicola protaetiae TaxID=2419771 RepID=A0A387BUL6_9MICO|nr:UDP-N-acetylglucosamine--N-acetylmuramyl-(pentapeptide) pyrophosphoryl-undecaprenol N-acetylglucosamine transferase [Gryllotalpicola protaetiae]AYG04756.1 UDP-N-acetylglucosamine--N-acetylmuramyl-(pentapeptide) pyrophosphoryl-undecaprenol N-acetylglucosamine transferase [Gryllotalpicola protaetiae]